MTEEQLVRRIVIATRIFTPEPAAAALRLEGLARALVSEGHEVEVLTTTFQNCPRVTRDGRLTVRRAPALRDESGVVRGYVQYLSFDIPLLLRLLASRRPDVIVNEPPPTTGVIVRLAAALRRVPYVYYAGDVLSDAATTGGLPGPAVAVLRKLERIALTGARSVIAVSPAVLKRVRELGARRATTVPNGIATDDYRDRNEAPPGFPPAEGATFLYAGTVAEWLAPETFIDAFAIAHRHLPGSRLIFLGQGTAWNSLKKYAQQFDVPISFHDAVPPSEARGWYAHADVALASIRPGNYDYAYPTKILAALAQGTPVIYAGRGPAVDDIRSGDLGIAVDLEPQQVARAMIDLAGRGRAHDERRRSRIRKWVIDNRSLSTSSRQAAQAVLDAASAAERGRRRGRRRNGAATARDDAAKSQHPQTSSARTSRA